LMVSLKELQLNEGQDLGFSTIEEVRQGFLVSSRLGQNRPLAKPHQQILLDFLQKH
jgi:8-oxo-dGTP diphosphatase